MQDLPKKFFTTQNGKVRPGRREPFELLRNSHAGGRDGCTGEELLKSSTRDRGRFPQERPCRRMSTFRRFGPGRREDSVFLRNTHDADEARFDFSILCSHRTFPGNRDMGRWRRSSGIRDSGPGAPLCVEDVLQQQESGLTFANPLSES